MLSSHHAGEHGALRGEETEEAGPENVSQYSEHCSPAILPQYPIVCQGNSHRVIIHDVTVTLLYFMTLGFSRCFHNFCKMFLNAFLLYSVLLMHYFAEVPLKSGSLVTLVSS